MNVRFFIFRYIFLGVKELTFRSYGVKELEGVKTSVCFMSLTRFVSVNAVLTSFLLLYLLPVL